MSSLAFGSEAWAENGKVGSKRERERIMENGKDESKVTKMNFAAKAKHFKWKSFSCAREGIRERS